MTIPLSAAQEMLWLLYRLAPDSRAYNVVLPVRVRSPLDPAELGRAVVALAERHEMLRSAYRELDGRPVRLVLDRCPVRLRVFDAPVADVRRLVTQIGAEPFALETGKPFRVVLIRHSPDDGVLVLVAHHIGCDATSIWLMLRDLLVLYAGVPLTPLSAWEDRHSQPGDPTRWRELCDGVPIAELPTDRPRPDQPGFQGASVMIHPGGPKRVRETARALKVTPFAVLLGVFEGLVRRYTGLDDFLIGCPVSTRSSTAQLDTVGNLVNTLLLRSRFTRGTTFADAAFSAQRQIRFGLSRMNCPLVSLSGVPAPRIAGTMLAVDRLQPPLPLVPVDAWEGPAISWHGLRLALVDTPHMEAQFDLNAEIRFGRAELSIAFRYDVELFDEGTIRAFTGGYLRLLDRALREPGTRVDAVPLTADSELDRVLEFGSGRAIGHV